jgi:hypothetical protein
MNRLFRNGSLALIFCAASFGVSALEPLQPADQVRQAFDDLPKDDLRIEAYTPGDTPTARVHVTGFSKSNARLSNLLRAIESSDQMRRVELISLMQSGNEYRFELSFEPDLPAPPPPSPPPPPVKRQVHRCIIDGREIYQARPCPASR